MDTNSSPPKREGIADWLVRVNGQISSWAASMTWWRLVLLFAIVMAAGAILSDQLHLHHDKVKVVKKVSGTGKDKSVDIDIGGPDGVHIRHRPKSGASSASGPEVAASGVTISPDAGVNIDVDNDEDTGSDQKVITRTAYTIGGFIGDLGSALIVLAFAYLVAAKIIVRKVAQADAKVRSAQTAAEHEAIERQLVQARLQVLQAQVEPHFLFNTLGAIDYLIETDPKRASQMQKALITYLRGALPQMRQDSSTLGRELRLIKSFLDLIKMRMEDRLDVEFNVPEGAESAEFPPMMLQSVVENAIKHGIEPRPEGGKVTVAARIQNGQLWVEVKDTGIGIRDMETLESPTSGTGLGLQNIRERLAVLYPGKSRLILVSDDTQGTTVKIVVPYQVGPETAAKFDGVQEKAA
jgi:signal transduction histidine kinase